MTLNSNSELRAEIARVVHASGEGHIPSCFSILDILDQIYKGHINRDLVGSEDPERDFFILSKGHGALALFVVLKKYGLISKSELSSYAVLGGKFGGHPDRTKHRAIEASTGSLGHGFPMAVGVALGKRIKNYGGRVITLLGDGETHEGTVWEAAHFAMNNHLGNLVAVVDKNDSAIQLLQYDNLEAKFRAFGWNVVLADGHDSVDLDLALTSSRTSDAPTAIIAKTVKGKGVSFLEGHGQWHHKIPSELELTAILLELNEL